MKLLRARHLHVTIVSTIAVLLATTPTAQVVEPVAWLIFVDDLHLDFRATGRHRDLIRSIAALAKPTDLVGIHATGQSSLVIDPSSDSASVRDAIKRVIGNGLRPSDFIGNPYDEASLRADRALGAALKAVSTLARTSASRKVLIYVSNGYVNFDRVRTSAARPELTSEARQFDVVVHTIDPREFAGASLSRDPKIDDAAWQAYLEETRASLHAIAQGTGGLATEDANIEAALKRIDVAARR